MKPVETKWYKQTSTDATATQCLYYGSGVVINERRGEADVEVPVGMIPTVKWWVRAMGVG